jgi:hypothetical protein
VKQKSRNAASAMSMARRTPMQYPNTLARITTTPVEVTTASSTEVPSTEPSAVEVTFTEVNFS